MAENGEIMTIDVMIEIPKGSRNKYEYDKELNVFRLDRTLYSPVHYPGAYGFVPRTLAEDGHRVRILAWGDGHLPTHEQLGAGVELQRIDLDRRISSALRPLPVTLRRVICRAIGLDPERTVLSPEPSQGLDRLRHPVRRLLEVVANARRVGPWADAVIARSDRHTSAQSL